MTVVEMAMDPELEAIGLRRLQEERKDPPPTEAAVELEAVKVEEKKKDEQVAPQEEVIEINEFAKRKMIAMTLILCLLMVLATLGAINILQNSKEMNIYQEFKDTLDEDYIILLIPLTFIFAITAGCYLIL